jgi:tRNA(adenine34) deaminase
MDQRIATTAQSDHELDRQMMRRTIALAIRSGEAGEYPHGVLVCRGGEVIAESTNWVAREHDVTRHAEMVAISLAQKALGTISLNDCVMYASAEPCVYCSYAIRESRVGRLVYGLHSPHMGGASRWNVLTDKNLSDQMPEVFDPPPEIVGGFMAYETEQALLKTSPLMWSFVRKRGLFIASPDPKVHARETQGWFKLMLLLILRRILFDRFGRQIRSAKNAPPILLARADEVIE